MPEGEEDDGLDGEELEDGVVLGQELTRGCVEEDEPVEGKGHGHVVEQCAVEVAKLWTVGEESGN